MTLETCEAPEIRLSMTEGVYFRNLNGNEAKDVLEITKAWVEKMISNKVFHV